MSIAIFSLIVLVLNCAIAIEFISGRDVYDVAIVAVAAVTAAAIVAGVL